MYSQLLETKNSSFRLLLEMSVFCYFYFRKKDKNIWIFGAIRGERYMDNSRFLFEYVCKNTSIQAIWISKNFEVIKELNASGYEAYHEYSKEALSLASKASVAIITHRSNRETSDLPFYALNNNTKIVQLWHGIPLKKIAFDDTIFSHKHNENSFIYKAKLFLKHTLFPFLNFVNTPSLILSLSSETQKLFSNAFRVKEDVVQVSGYPRNDRLLDFKKEPRSEKKIIYMPTFRGSLGSNHNLFSEYGFDVDTFDTFLEKENSSLHVKIHAFNQPSNEFLEAIRCSKHISVIKSNDIYDDLGGYDILITDYSSVYFDYLLLDLPIIFTPFDKELYVQENREFYFEYEEVTPGPKAYNWHEVMENISMFNRDALAYADKRVSIKNRFHTYQDANSSKRVYTAIQKLLDV